MTDKAKKVLAGYIKLSYSDREEIRKNIDEYEKAQPLRKSQITEQIEKSAEKIILGPGSGGGCPCCGR